MDERISQQALEFKHLMVGRLRDQLRERDDIIAAQQQLLIRLLFFVAAMLTTYRTRHFSSSFN
jgi:hypothetical protein